MGGGGGESSRGRRGLDLKSSGGGGGGEIVEVEGGHIMRSIGRKDRHSKVCTAKGPRDRRVRLAAHTAIQFYDVQDRLGYDRPSKAVDWLIKNAKSAIDELDQLPPWHPTANAAIKADEDAQKKLAGEDDEEGDNPSKEEQPGLNHAHDSVAAGKRAAAITTILGGEHNPSSFLPPSLDSDSIADTIKSFFPMGAPAEPSTSSAAQQFQRFPTSDLLPRMSSSTNHTQSQDLKLSLQSFQENHHLPTSPLLLSGTPIGGFDASAAAAFWPDHHHHSDGNVQSEIGLYSPSQSALPYHHLLHHNQLFPQRGPLQSSNMPSIRAWMDYPSISSADYNNQQQSHNHYVYPTSVSGMGYHQPGFFSGFQMPARIQGDEEEHDGYSDKPSSASSDSTRH